MVFDFVYEEVTMPKSEFFNWLITTMEDKGWVLQSKGKEQYDHYCMFSTGEDGESKIGVQFRKYYRTSTNNPIDNHTYGIFAARPYHTYTPSPNLTGAGTVSQNGDFMDIRVSPDQSIDELYKIWYHCNKDRMIMIVENADYQLSQMASLMVFGMPHMLSEKDEFNHSTVMASNNYIGYFCRSAAVNYHSKTTHIDSHLRHTVTPKGLFNGLQHASEMIVYNTYEGDRNIVENVFSTNFTNNPIKNLTNSMRNYRYKDSEGRIYKLCVLAYNPQSVTNMPTTYLIRIG